MEQTSHTGVIKGKEKYTLAERTGKPIAKRRRKQLGGTQHAWMLDLESTGGGYAMYGREWKEDSPLFADGIRELLDYTT